METEEKDMTPTAGANQSFSRAVSPARDTVQEKNGHLYTPTEPGAAERYESLDDEAITAISNRLIAKNREAYEILAQ